MMMLVRRVGKFSLFVYYLSCFGCARFFSICNHVIKIERCFSSRYAILIADRMDLPIWCSVSRASPCSRDAEMGKIAGSIRSTRDV